MNEEKDDLVRCNECVYWKRMDSFVGYCILAEWMIAENGFCLYAQGEKKDEK